MKRWSLPGLPVLVLLVIYTAVVLADVLAPYDYFEQNRDLPLAPPTRLHFIDADGRFHLRPFVYRLVEQPDRPGHYVEDIRQRYPVRFFIEGSSVRRFGPFELRRRLAGVDGEARLLLLGTDRLGRDQFSRLLYGGRISLGAGLLAGVAAVALGLVIGAMAGYFGAWLDAVLMRSSELFQAFPPLYLLLAVRAALPLELSALDTFLVTVLVISLLSWVRPARMVRGVVLSARERDYVAAARGFGASPAYLLWRHVLPETRAVVATHLAILVPRLVMAEVTLSFLGLGIAEPMPSWGLMLAELSRPAVLVRCWWMGFPAVALILVIIGYHHVAGVMRKRPASVALP